jgi:hypothetical protein
LGADWRRKNGKRIVLGSACAGMMESEMLLELPGKDIIKTVIVLTYKKENTPENTIKLTSVHQRPVVFKEAEPDSKHPACIQPLPPNVGNKSK